MTSATWISTSGSVGSPGFMLVRVVQATTPALWSEAMSEATLEILISVLTSSVSGDLASFALDLPSLCTCRGELFVEEVPLVLPWESLEGRVREF